MTWRTECRTIYASLPLWKRQRARVAALVRHHPEDQERIANELAMLHGLRIVEFVREMYRRGWIDHIAYVEAVGPLLCPDAIARSDA